ncbi:izumo sperm-egg fusion protein 1 isoform X2 [Xyrichtys novacula]|uniref:Izumo sperm-egg fusion protein 1 isoform X2 n=1 Tax=Xyrichtys novacula TaxID=13765 RepID=A0AAV1G7E0_XYRNO|nr:izumo sperm-egg fusion protein 1 isoform X2 [Xyrichtys novacula]
MRSTTGRQQRAKNTELDDSEKTGSREEMLLMLVSLLCCVCSAETCLQCDSKIRLLHEDFALSASTVDDQIELKKICDHAYVTYRDTSRHRKGVIDPTTLYRARTEYQSEFDHFLKSQHTGSVTFEAIMIMEKGRRILERHLDTFIRDGLCPNKCGLLRRRIMDCFSCRYKIYICPSPTGQQDCGEYPVQAEEGGQAVLNCFLPWHRLLLKRPEYHFSWAPGVPGTEKLSESDFCTLVVTEDSTVILNQLHVNEQGTYRCSLQGRNGTIFYRVTFLLTVTPLSNQTHRPVVTLPALPHGDDHSRLLPIDDLLVPAIATVTALGLAASVGLAVILGLLIYQRKAMKRS